LLTVVVDVVIKIMVLWVLLLLLILLVWTELVVWVLELRVLRAFMLLVRELLREGLRVD
jgi:hypothetical protein